ncbi:hypothetical protein D6774_02760 [Candidatus Woesearchaeota archaeon]|nr:MAG: hypothetical protein D6774_02760 [Candidatus Woesearchaeota archaeon]
MVEYLGIDESHISEHVHVYVGVPSNEEVSCRKKQLGKTRGSLQYSRLCNLDFRFVVVRDWHLHHVPFHVAQSAAHATLIQFFNPTSVFIDGKRIEKHARALEERLHKESEIDIHYIRKGDKKIPLINQADHLAYLLRRHFEIYGYFARWAQGKELLPLPFEYSNLFVASNQ